MKKVISMVTAAVIAVGLGVITPAVANIADTDSASNGVTQSVVLVDQAYAASGKTYARVYVTISDDGRQWGRTRNVNIYSKTKKNITSVGSWSWKSGGKGWCSAVISGNKRTIKIQVSSWHKNYSRTCSFKVKCGNNTVPVTVTQTW